MTNEIDLQSGNASYTPQQILVVIPALNEAAHIESCILSLLHNDVFAQGTTVVVADGGSIDGTQDIVKKLAQNHADLHLLHNPQKLQSAGINAAVEKMARPHHRLVVRCDAHAVYPANYIADIAKAFENKADAASIVTVMDAHGSNCFQRAAAWTVDTPLGSGGSAHRGGTRSAWVDHGHHAGFQLTWFNKIGGYDPTFSHNEDAEFDHRLGLAGGRVWLESSVRLDYEMRPNPLRLARQYWAYGRGRARTVAKHQMRPRVRQMVPVLNFLLLVICVVLLPTNPLWGFFPALYLGLLAAVSAFCTIKLRSFCGLWAGLVVGIIHNTWAIGFLIQIVTGIGVRK